MINKLKLELKDFIIKIGHCGSRVTCNPAPTNTDDDYMLLVKSFVDFREFMEANGYVLGGSDIGHEDNTLPPDSRFMSFVKDYTPIVQTETVKDFFGICTPKPKDYVSGQVNLIVTESEIFYDKFMLATHVSTRLNLMEKEHRIVLFQAILYGMKL